jgi:hypothetical protein
VNEEEGESGRRGEGENNSMSEIESQLEGVDLDWYGLDENNQIGHFASGTVGALPPYLSANIHDRALIHGYFTEVRIPCSEAKVDPDALVRGGASNRDAAGKDWFLGSFVEMARCGTFSYDCFLYDPPPTGYFRVASPTVPLKLSEVPDAVRAVLERSRLPNVNFERDAVLNAEFQPIIRPAQRPR